MSYQLFEGDCLEIMPVLGAGSVNLIAVDLPYFGVKSDEWDNQWSSRDDFLSWVGHVCDEWQRILAPNGSVYAFASPQMAWHVEGVIRERFNVLSNIRWQKPPYATKAEMFDKDLMRSVFPASETIIFAEKGDGDTIADAIAGFTEAETQLKKRIFGDYLADELKRAQVANRQIAGLFPSATGGMTGCVSNWILGLNVPTPEQYQIIRTYLNSLNCAKYLHREYEDLRREYEDLRRPFNASPDAPYTDVWTFPTVPNYPGKHPAEKPIDLMEHIVNLSSRPGDVVLDCCMGNGTTGIAAGKLKRKFIGMERDKYYYDTAQKRIAAAYGDWDNAFVARKLPSSHADLPLFAMFTPNPKTSELFAAD